MKNKTLLTIVQAGFRPANQEKISEEEIMRLVRYEALEQKRLSVTKEEICFDLIKITRCRYTHAKNVFDEMEELGLGLCTSTVYSYQIHKFAIMRGYITTEESKQTIENMIIEEAKQEKFEKDFVQKYGQDMSKWSDETWKKYDRGVME
jgi:hypothetical protein